MSTQINQNKPNSLLKSSFVVGGMTFISRISGFMRDIVFANIFGASASTDAFFVAFKIPNFFRRLFAEGAFIQAFVPVLNEFKIKIIMLSTISTASGGTGCSYTSCP